MLGKRLLAVAEAIKEHEGWIYDDIKTAGKNEESIAMRNNNPGNLRSSPFMIGQRGGFAYFYNEEIGNMALLWDLFQKCNGNTMTNLRPESTLADLIAVYAPPSENDTLQYIKIVESKTGIPRNMKLKELLEK